MSFLHPNVLFFALSALAPLAAFAWSELRARRVRRVIGEPTPRTRRQAPVVLALATIPALLAVGAAEPVVERNTPRTERADIEAYVVIDTSGSMAASLGPLGKPRLARA